MKSSSYRQLHWNKSFKMLIRFVELALFGAEICKELFQFFTIAKRKEVIFCKNLCIFNVQSRQPSLHKKSSFPLRIFSVNVSKSALSCSACGIKSNVFRLSIQAVERFCRGLIFFVMVKGDAIN